MRAAALALLLIGCDIVVSVGDHDVGDATLLDAPPPVDAPTHDGGACHATDAGACQACQASQCCDALVACDASPPCSCLADCILRGSTSTACITHCGGMDHGEHEALVTCSTDRCTAVCP